MVKYYYRKNRSPVFEDVLRPIGNIMIMTKGGKWINFRPIIASGADISVIPYSLGIYLGFEMEEKVVEFGGVTGNNLPVLIKNLNIRIGDVELEPRVAWALIEEAPPLLGRMDIFNRFTITFNEKEGFVDFDYNG